MNSKIRFIKPGGTESTANSGPVTSAEERTYESGEGALENSTQIFNPYAATYSIKQQRQQLPIYPFRRDIFHALETYQTLIVAGETGSGKTTQIPQYLAEFGWADYPHESKKFSICLTQPRKAAAIGAARRIAEESGRTLGRDVGYVIRFESCYDPKFTKIKVVTGGILLREMMQDPLLSSYSVVMLDEAHERSIETDILFGLLRKVLKKRPDLRLVVSSATLDVERVRTFFDLSKDIPHQKLGDGGMVAKRKRQPTATIIVIKTRTFPIDVYYLQNPVADYIEATVTTILDIYRHTKYGDILAFLPGKDEIQKTIDMINDRLDTNSGNQKNSKAKEKLTILPMYSALPESEQMKVLETSRPNTRKVVVSTNIAETSLTINGILYVVDCGFEKIKVYDPHFAVDILVLVPISKASAIQRAGRAGRTAHGRVFRLYTEKSYTDLNKTEVPEMQRSNMAAPILQLKAFGVDIITFNYISPPPSQNLIRGLEVLYFLKAIDRKGNLTADYGRFMAEFPLPPQFSRMIIASLERNCVREILYITAMLQIKNVFSYHPSKRLQADSKKLRKFGVKEGDHFTYLNIFTAFLSYVSDGGKEGGFCGRHFLNHKGLTRALYIYRQLANHVIRHFAGAVGTGNDNSDPAFERIDSIRDSLEDLRSDPALDGGTSRKVKADDSGEEDDYENDYRSSASEPRKWKKRRFHGDDELRPQPNPDNLLRCIISGFFSNAAYYHSSATYRTLKDDYGPLLIHPDSVLFSLNPPPKYVVFNEIVRSAGGTAPESAYMFDVVALPGGDPSVLYREVPDYFYYGTANQIREAQQRHP